MTEEKAKQRWCPFSRSGELSGGGNRLPGHTPTEESTRCLGSACAVWHETHVRRTFLVQAHGKHSDWEEWNWDPRTKPTHEHFPTKDGIVEPHGHCGLVGKP